MTKYVGQLAIGQFNQGTSASGSTYWNGAGTWNAVSGAGSFINLGTQTASNSSVITFTGLSSSYSQYMCVLQAISPVSASNLLIQVSLDNGSTYKSGATDYFWNTGGFYDNGSALGAKSTGDTSINLMAGAGGATLIDTTAAGALCGQVYLTGAGTTNYCKVQSFVNFYFNSGFGAEFTCRGYYQTATTAVNAVQFLMSSGNINSGKFTLYGLLA